MNDKMVIVGGELGEHGFDAETIDRELKEKIIDKGLHAVTFGITGVPDDKFPTKEEFARWARTCKEHKIYFHISRTAQLAPKGRLSRFDKETVEAINDAAGEYFLGDCIAEPGLAYSAKGERFFADTYSPNFVFDNVKDAHDNYVKIVKRFVDNNKSVGMRGCVTVESTMLTKYNIEAGIKFHVLEAPNGDADMLIPSMRGAVRNLGINEFHSLIAHEWYGGMRHEDILKRKRLELLWKYLYISGASSIKFESGSDIVSSYGHTFDYDSDVCADYRRAQESLLELTKTDERPAGLPKVKFGIISGLYDGYAGFCNSSVWAQFGRAEWGHGEAEYSYRLILDMANKRRWCDVNNYGSEDTSSFPAYGTYDIVPIESDVEALSKYEHLVFLGWNTMTDENMEKIYQYVKGGGKLLLSAAHLNYSVKREGEFIIPSNEWLEKLCGCRYAGEDVYTNCGTKFRYTSVNEKHLYPGSLSYGCDPLFSAGYTTYMKTELCGGEALGYATNTWGNNGEPIVNTVIENKIGDGTVTFVTSKNYPGHPALAPLYSMLLSEFVSSSARECEIKVISSDKLRYSVYEGGKLYLLNTDYDFPITVKIVYGEKEQTVTLDSLELKALTL